jgi:hypothetical protein
LQQTGSQEKGCRFFCLESLEKECRAAEKTVKVNSFYTGGQINKKGGTRAASL